MGATKRQREPPENSKSELVAGTSGGGHASCAVCLKTADETDEKALRENHGCSTCASGAWRICVACHDSLLSRDCPLCRSPYEGLELFPFEFSADPPHDTERCVFALIVRSSNVIVWETASRRASFMLAPQNKDAAGAAGMHVAVGGVDLSNHSFGKEQDGRYLFDTSLWAALEEDDAQQEDDEDKIETVPFDIALKKIQTWVATAKASQGGGGGGGGQGGRRGAGAESTNGRGGRGADGTATQGKRHTGGACQVLTPIAPHRLQELSTEYLESLQLPEGDGGGKDTAVSRRAGGMGRGRRRF